MFLDVLRRRNPQLIEQAIALHQAGRIPANAYVIDLDAVEANARTIQAAADRLGLKVFAMTKQMGRSPSFCAAVARGGIAKAVVVDMEDARACHRAGLAIGHIGHLVQIPRAETAAAASLEPDYWTVFNFEKAAAAAEAARMRGRIQDMLARIQTEGDTFYRGHEGGFEADDVVAVADRIDAREGARFAGITTFPALLFDVAKRKIAPTPNLRTLEKAAAALARAGRERHRDQRARHQFLDRAASARRCRRDPGRTGPRPHRNDAAARRRGPAGAAGGRLSQRGVAPLSRRRLLLRRRPLHRSRCFPTMRSRRSSRASRRSPRMRSAPSRFRVPAAIDYYGMIDTATGPRRRSATASFSASGRRPS